MKCKTCKGTGLVIEDGETEKCPMCTGIGHYNEVDGDDDEYIEPEPFWPCDNCDLPDACEDFGCAIKAGIKEDPEW